jgi:hypothetical protein
MTEYTIVDKRDDEKTKCNYYIKQDGQVKGMAVEEHEAIWMLENLLSKNTC